MRAQQAPASLHSLSVCAVFDETSPTRKLSHAANAGRHPLADRGRDVYETPPEATRALLAVEKLPHWLWEPAAGPGAIVSVLRAAGHAVIASDVMDYGFPLHFQRDFLDTTAALIDVEAIVTNPPYRDAQQFVAHALDLCPRVVMLLRLAFLESERRSRFSTVANSHACTSSRIDCQ